jgi:hypothetical protein
MVAALSMLTRDPFQSELIQSQVERVKSVFLDGIGSGHVQDVAFVGNASGLYTWIPGVITDLDVCLFVERRDRHVGIWLKEMRARLGRDLLAEGTEFELRIVRGPYKQTMSTPGRPSIVAHTGVFTDELYLQLTGMLRWAWRKYRCHIDSERMARLATAKPSLEEFLEGRGGVLRRLQTIHSGQAPMAEYLLPEFEENTWTTIEGEPLFAEYCLASAATCSRNHARIQDRTEADALDNLDFAAWYTRNFFASKELHELFRLKERVRYDGYAEAVSKAPALALSYLSNLYSSFERSAAPD